MLYRVIANSTDECLETFEAATDDAAKIYATTEHADYGYLLQAAVTKRGGKIDFWREIDWHAGEQV